MITEKELFNFGFVRKGDEDNGPYYVIHLDGTVFGLHTLSGNFDEKGRFEIYDMKGRKFTLITELNIIFTVNMYRD